MSNMPVEVPKILTNTRADTNIITNSIPRVTETKDIHWTRIKKCTMKKCNTKEDNIRNKLNNNNTCKHHQKRKRHYIQVVFHQDAFFPKMLVQIEVLVCMLDTNKCKALTSEIHSLIQFILMIIKRH